MIYANMLIGTMELATASIALLTISTAEGIVISKYLAHKTFDTKVFYFVFASNVISSLVGLVGLLTWVVDLMKAPIKQVMGLPPDSLSPYFSIAITLIAFLLTVPLEILTNILLLRRSHPINQIAKSTFYSNLLSYVLLGALLFIVAMNAL